MALSPWHLLVHIAISLRLANSQCSRGAPSFLQRSSSRHVLKPSEVDKNFLKSLEDAPGDVLVLLYSPSCPDSEWLMKKVWTGVAQKLEAVAGMSVMTVSDYGFNAPKPFEHWVNPAIFLARKDHKMEPIFFPNARLQEYLAGMPSRPQDQQDSDFTEDLLVFAQGAEGVRVFSQPKADPSAQGQPLQEVAKLGEKMFKILQDKWADPDYQKAQTGPETEQAPAVASVVAAGQAVAQKQDSDQQAMSYAEEFVRTHPNKGYTVHGVYKYAAPYYKHKAEAEHHHPAASLVASSQVVQRKQPHELAQAYAEQFVKAHPGKGYKVANVLQYALPYYETHS